MKIGASLLLAVTVGVFAFSATPAMAFTEFLQKQAKSGNQGKGGKQIFKMKGGTFECEEEKSNGGTKEEKSNQLSEEIKYEKCKVFSSLVVSPARFTFRANGTMSLDNTVTMKEAGCEFELTPAGNKELSGITYINNAFSGISVRSSPTGVSYKVNKNGGGICGTDGESKNMTIEGEFKSEQYKGELPQYVGNSETVSQPSYGNFEARASEVATNPTEVKFGNTTKAERTVEYTNKGTGSWTVPALKYTVTEGSEKAVSNKNDCLEKTLGAGEKCSVTLTYEVPVSESYHAELKLGIEAPTVTVTAEK